MKKIIAMLTILAMPLLSQAVYVSFKLTEYPVAPYYDGDDIVGWYTRSFADGYYLMLIDNTFTRDQFYSTLANGSSDKDLADIPSAYVLYQNSVYSATGGFELDTTADRGYLALFTTAEFPNDAYYALYSAQSLTGSKTVFDEALVWFDNGTPNGQKLNNLQNTIPEPSSGLLMLAGFSLLALKRKRRACVFC